MSQLDAGSATDELQGGDLDVTWSLDDNRGRVSSGGNSLGFSGIENITGGSGIDIFIVSSGALNNIDTGAGDDSVNLDGGLVNSINVGAGDDVVELNNVASASVSLLVRLSGSFELGLMYGHDPPVYVFLLEVWVVWDVFDVKVYDAYWYPMVPGILLIGSTRACVSTRGDDRLVCF